MTTITEKLLGIGSAINIISTSLDDVSSKQQDWINSTDVLFESLNKKITGNLTNMSNLSKEVSIESSVPEKRYQLDLTVGDQKLSAFTDLSPEKFIEALLKARGTAI